jgi:hypothetical protein
VGENIRVELMRREAEREELLALLGMLLFLFWLVLDGDVASMLG